MMALDKEQQARQTFLAEAETYFGEIENVLLKLQTADDRASQINIAMRAAHSVKGTAGMMGFKVLSQIAHQLEDSFKILQARQLSVDTQLETLLLQGVDCLRTARQEYHDQKLIDIQWFDTHVNPIFIQLTQRLGELTPEDEARLLSEEADENLDFVIFTTSVEDCLEELEQSLTQLKGDELKQAVVAMAQRLSEFGLMAQLDAFVSLCQSVQQQCAVAPADTVDGIAAQAMKAWQRSHSLVLLGRTERLPTELQPAANHGESLSESIASEFLVEPTTELPDNDISYLQEQLATLDLAAESLNLQELPEVTPFIDNSPVELEVLQTELAELPAVEQPSEEVSEETEVVRVESEPAVPQPAAADTAALPAASQPPAETEVEPVLVPLTPPPRLQTPDRQKVSTVRVSIDQLKQINSSFEDLVLNRNSVNLKLEQLHTFSQLMQERMLALASFNRELRQWYDQASTEGMVADSSTAPKLASQPVYQNGAGLTQSQQVSTLAISHELDVLEFDRYSKLHLLAQEHMETIVKLEEVSRDIELGLSEMGQAISSLNYTSRALKTRITQTQMRSFEEIVGRFPRVVRDWSVQYNKPVTLKIEGETTLLERFALDQLSDPLLHLLRNAFDHGIEAPEVREANQKPSVGTISLRAVNRGNRVVITLSDDGGGIDLDSVRDRIHKYNLPQQQIDNMSQQELLSFIFEPGFSTSTKVTELSGRGFGMDIVRTNLKQLQGDIQVTTEPGKGTTFTIIIPLSLSILRVMLLERNGSVFALSVDAVQEIIRTQTDPDQTTLTWQDSSIPLVQLEDHWSINCAARPLEMSGKPLINHAMVVVVGEAENSYGLAVDRFWKEQEVAIRPVASPMPMPASFGGVTVLGDGRVIPLIDPDRLMTWITEKPDSTETTPVDPVMALSASTSRILVVDDSIHARRYLASSLERSGYLIEQAKDGREAVDKMINGLDVQAIICDIEMPRLDGYGVLEELRDQPQFSQLPILMLTSRSSEKHRKLAMNLGATDYFSKPYNEQELLKTLGLLIS